MKLLEAVDFTEGELGAELITALETGDFTPLLADRAVEWSAVSGERVHFALLASLLH